MSTTGHRPRCAICVDATAELRDEEHGPVCVDCAELLAIADELCGDAWALYELRREVQG